LKKIDHRVHCETIASIAVKEKLPPAKPQKKPKTRKEKTSRPLRNLRAHCGKIKPQEGMFLSRKVTKPPKKKTHASKKSIIATLAKPSRPLRLKKNYLPPSRKKKPKTRKEKTSRPLRNLRALCGKIKSKEGMFLSRKVTKPQRKRKNVGITSQLPYF
jgi:hypothetical protein